MCRPIVVLLILLLIAPVTLLAQTSEPPAVPPPDRPAESAPPEVAPAPEAAPNPAPAPVHHKKRTRRRRRHHAVRAPELETTVEPTNERLKVRSSGAAIYARADRESEPIGKLNADMYVQVTGSTKSYLQVQLKDGRVGYIDPSTVDLVAPIDKQFLLTSNSPVYDAPNQFAQKVAEVHRGKYIHVIGHALGYVQIRMKDGTEGYVPMTAAQ